MGGEKKERKKIIFYAPGYLHVPNRFLSILKLGIEMIFLLDSHDIVNLR